MSRVQLTYGPPGTGKTWDNIETIVRWGKEGIPLNSIAAMSFTKKGAYTLRDRAILKLQQSKADFPYAGTIHSLAFRQLGIVRNQMLTNTDIRNFGDAVGMKFSGLNADTTKDDRYMRFIDLYRNNPDSADSLLQELNPNIIEFIQKNYKSYKNKIGRMDFTDLLSNYLKVGRPLPISRAILDEGQDTSSIQWRAFWLLTKDADEIVIAGDDDQAIYKWSGADVRYYMSIKGDAKVLDQSYRLSKKVHLYAGAIADVIYQRIPKHFKPTQEEGEVVEVTDLMDVPFNKTESWYVLGRTHYILDQRLAPFKDKGIVYYRGEQLSYSLGAIRAIRAHESLRNGKEIDRLSALDYKEHLKAGLEDELKMDWWEVFDFEPEELVYYKELLDRGINTDPNILAATIHAVKGGEADNVVLFLDYTAKVHKNMQTQEGYDDEMRAYYVAVTRARKRLYLVRSKSTYEYPIFMDAVIEDVYRKDRVKI